MIVRPSKAPCSASRSRSGAPVIANTITITVNATIARTGRRPRRRMSRSVVRSTGAAPTAFSAPIPIATRPADQSRSNGPPPGA